MSERSQFSDLAKIERPFNTPLIMKGDCAVLVGDEVQILGVGGMIDLGYALTLSTKSHSEFIRVTKDGLLGETIRLFPAIKIPVLLDDQISAFYLSSKEGGFYYKFNFLVGNQAGASLFLEATSEIQLEIF